jgi:hypothetical protein
MPLVKSGFHDHISETKLADKHTHKVAHKQMSHIFVIFVNQKFLASQISLPQTHLSDFVTEFVSKFVDK